MTASPDSPIKVVFLDAAGTLFRVKRSVADIYLDLAVPYGFRRGPDSREAMLGGGYAAALNDQLPPVERQLLTRDGHIVDVLALSRAELGADGQPRGTRVGFIDISARKAAEAARHEALRRAKTLLETSLDGIIATDRVVQQGRPKKFTRTRSFFSLTCWSIISASHSPSASSLTKRSGFALYFEMRCRLVSPRPPLISRSRYGLLNGR